LEERAQRLFSTKGKSYEDIDPSLFAKAKGNSSTKEKDFEKQKDIAALEAQIYRYFICVPEVSYYLLYL